MRLLLTILLILAATYVGLCAALFFFQRSLLYFPQPRFDAAAPTLELSREGERILVTVRARPGRDAVLYFGGNAEDVSMSVPDVSDAFPEHALYLLHYRGYGGSSGAPSEPALVGDALALFDEAAREHDRVTVIGRSLGSGIAVQVASQRPIARLVLVTPYDSILNLAKEQFPYFPVTILLRDKFESWRFVDHVSAPVYLIAAEHDEVIPTLSTRALFQRFQKGKAHLTMIPGVGHNTIATSPNYVPALRTAIFPEGQYVTGKEP